MSNSIISIEGGCSYSPKFDTWSYSWEDSEGFHTVAFISNTVPKIGDTIVGNFLVPLLGYKINNDPGFQIKR